MPPEITVVGALSLVMQDVRKVTKTGFNQQQNYKFRGVDATINAVGPVLRKHGVIVLPTLVSERMETFQTAKGSTMYRSVVVVTYRFIGPAGDDLSATVAGEGSDSLDKATSKAMSVAYRTALLQALCLPTDDPDPDSFSPPAAVQPGDQSDRSRLAVAKAKVWKLAQERGWDTAQLADHYRQTTSAVIGEATAAHLNSYADSLSRATK
jgi:hypothetical protein